MRAADGVRLGRSGLVVSRLGLGTAPLSGLFEPIPEETAVATVRAALAHGLRHVDTAPLYGYGRGEERVGRALAGRGRDEYVLATKAGRLLRPAPPERPHLPPLEGVFDFSRDGILRSVEHSLHRLGLDRLDLVHLHDPDDHERQALDEAYPALDELRRQGVVGAIGAGMTQWQMPLRFAREADFDAFLLAGRWTLLDQSGLELLDVCAERGVAVIAGSVFHSGVLADPDSPGATFDYRPPPAAVVEHVARLVAVCRRHGVPLAAAALQFPLAHPAVATVVVGCRTPLEVAENVRLVELEIPAELWEDLRAEGLLPEPAPLPSP